MLRMASRFQSRRGLLLALFAILLAPFFFLTSFDGYRPPPSWIYNDVGRYILDKRLVEMDSNHTLPPLYPYLKWVEDRLPQHDEEAPWPDGRAAKFVRFSAPDHAGFNNVLSEALIAAYLATLSGRAYVFGPYEWLKTNLTYVPAHEGHSPAGSTKWSRPLRAARTPLTAFIQGPLVGSPWPPNKDQDSRHPLPRAISVSWFDEICPNATRTMLSVKTVNAQLGLDASADEASTVVKRWAKHLTTLDARCVEIDAQIIDFDMLASSRLVSLWEGFSASPVVTTFNWSPLVLTAVERNMPKLLPHSTFQENGTAIPGLVSIHARRGDYEKWCTEVSEHENETLERWSLLPFLPDRFDPPDTSSPEKITAYRLSRCWVELPAIIVRLTALREKEPSLKRVFVSTNGTPEWIAQLRKALIDAGWEAMLTSTDLDLTWEESGVDNAIDMELASRAEVFVGNGFSSFTSTVVRLRLTRGIALNATRFW